ALDKTGTLTEGRPYLTDVVVLDPASTREEVLTWAARAEAGSEHPLARPVLEAAAAEGLSTAGLPEATEPVPGKGITATTGGRRVLIGNAALLEQYGIADTVGAGQVADELAAAGRTAMIVTLDETVAGVVAVAGGGRGAAAEMDTR